jgi:hypothetical protein
MKMANNKFATIAISILFIVSMSTSIILVPSALAAHNPAWELPTTAHVAALPEVTGVGQSITIYAWLDRIFDGALPSGNANANQWRFHNFTVVIDRPDNTSDTLYKDRIEDTTSNQAFSYTPEVAGNYTVTFYFPGMAYATGTAGIDYNPNSAYVNDTYLPSSAKTTFTVTEDAQPLPIDTYPLPTEYWTRPIYGENSIWYLISSNWLGAGAAGYGGFANSYNSGGNGQANPTDAVGPLTGHIMWTKPLQSGGVVGGDQYDILGNTYFEGSAYLQRYMNPIIVNGRIYYSEPLSYSTSNGYAEVCVDLRTGEQVWRVVGMPQPSFAYIPDIEDYNQHGVSPAYLVSVSGTTWRFYDADTGVSIFNATNIPASTTAKGNVAAGPSGEQLRYIISNTSQGFTLGQWNSSKLWVYNGNTPSINGTNVAGTITVDGGISTWGNYSCRYDWNVSIPWRNTMSSCTILYSIYDDMMLCMNGSFPSGAPTMFMGTLGFNPYTYFAVNLNASSTKYDLGEIMWMKTYDPPANNKTVLFAGVDPVNRVFVENIREDIYFKGYSLDDGSYLWSTTPQEPMDYYGSPASGSISNTFAYGNMYSSAYAGIVYCYDTKTGNVTWTYGNGGEGNSTQGGFEVPGHWPTFINAIGSGVVYTTTTEHTIETPLAKGALSRGINATDGTEIWTLSSYVGEFGGNSYAIADGYATWFNGLDNQIYVVGKGPSQTTVEAPQTQITAGDKVVIQGTVMDLSAGTTQDEQAARFASGVPCASDASMADWMGYVYQQKPIPTNFTGVEVTIMAVDPNNNFITLGSATTDEYGVYHYTWTTPDVTGDYTIYAVFSGTNGYWGSKATTNMVVTEAAASPTPAPTQPPSAADLYFLPMSIAIIIAVVVIGAILALLLVKKHP